MTELRTPIKPFLIVALFWVVMGILGCQYFSVETGSFSRSLIWFLGLWTLCLLDLVALTKTVQSVLRMASSSDENRAACAIQTFSWGAIKLVCLGFFTLVLIQGRTIPIAGLLFGMATLLVVPLFGGLIWSQKALGVS